MRPRAAQPLRDGRQPASSGEEVSTQPVNNGTWNIGYFGANSWFGKLDVSGALMTM